MSKIAVVSIKVAKPGKESELEAALRALVAPSQQEDGCIQYDLHKDLDKPDTFVFYERWDSRAHLDVHGKSEHLAKLREVAPGLVERSELFILEHP